MNVRRFFSLASLLLALSSPARLSALPADASFKIEGQEYVAEAVGKGSTEAEARNDAAGRAIRTIMESLGRDRLFEELFVKNPPVSMTMKTLSSEKGAATWSVRLRLSVDDESLRILYNTAYLSTVSTLLDQAERGLSEAERLAAEARQKEGDGDLGSAMSLYWQARDACDTGLGLVEPIGDAAVFSTFGKKKAPELRAVLDAARNAAIAGYERIKEAERGLAADEELKSATAALEGLEAKVAEMEAWSAGLGKRAAAIESSPPSELAAFSGELGSRLGALKDARAALGRITDAVPASRSLLRGRIDVARRRIDGLSKYLASTKRDVDRERRVPAAVRARRARNVRWALLHEPSGAFSARVFSPFGLDPSSESLAVVDTGCFEFRLRAEGALGESRGVWVATAFDKDDTELSEEVKDVAYSQSFDLGFFGRTLWGAGVGWDWLRSLDGEPVAKRLAIRAFLGGIEKGRASWQAVASWELPYEIGSFEAVNVFNIGLESFLRLGKFAELNLAAELRPRRMTDELLSCLAYSAGFGVRIPGPFLWGVEFAGGSAEGEEENFADSYFRLFAEYSL